MGLKFDSFDMKEFMMRILVLLMMVLMVPSAAQARSEGIAAVVNDGAISFSDLSSRMQLIIASSGLPNNEDTQKKLVPQILKSLIEEELQAQEAARLEVAVTDAELQGEFDSVAKLNGLTPEQFMERLSKSGADIPSFQRQLKARVAWSKVFVASLRGQVRVTDADVDAYLERKRAQIGKTEYLLSEIFLPVDELSDEAEVKRLARDVVADLRAKKVQFGAVAQQISKAPGALKGGALGWVQSDQLDADVAGAVMAMTPKTISAPLRSVAGYQIFYLSDTRAITEESIPSPDAVRQQLGAQRSERISRNRLADLRSAAFIDIRL